MKTIKVAFDVDGTLRCNCTDTCEDPNMRIVRMFNIMASFKNVEMFVWSGGGKEYAMRFANLFELRVAHKNCISKIGAPAMDIAVDDQHEFNQADINLIVREKRKNGFLSQSV